MFTGFLRTYANLLFLFLKYRYALLIVTSRFFEMSNLRCVTCCKLDLDCACIVYYLLLCLLYLTCLFALCTGFIMFRFASHIFLLNLVWYILTPCMQRTHTSKYNSGSFLTVLVLSSFCIFFFCMSCLLSFCYGSTLSYRCTWFVWYSGGGTGGGGGKGGRSPPPTILVRGRRPSKEFLDVHVD